LKKASSQIPTLKTDSDFASSNTAKASKVLSQNFNRTIPPLANTDYHFFMADPLSTFPEEIFCTEEEVLDLLLTVDTNIAIQDQTGYLEGCSKLLLTLLHLV